MGLTDMFRKKDENYAKLYLDATLARDRNKLNDIFEKWSRIPSATDDSNFILVIVLIGIANRKPREEIDLLLNKAINECRPVDSSLAGQYRNLVKMALNGIGYSDLADKYF